MQLCVILNTATFSLFTALEQQQFMQSPPVAPRCWPRSIGVIDGVVINIEKPSTDRRRGQLASLYKHRKKGWGVVFLVVIDRVGLSFQTY